MYGEDNILNVMQILYKNVHGSKNFEYFVDMVLLS